MEKELVKEWEDLGSGSALQQISWMVLGNISLWDAISSLKKWD